MASEPINSAPSLIDTFKGEHFWLSNFYEGAPFTMHGVTYPTGEHAFQAAKTNNPLSAHEIAVAPSPGAAKGLGRRTSLRPDWEAIKRDVMADVVASRFGPDNPDMQARLKATDTALLIESVTWCDQTWGDCVCDRHRSWPGKNWLGKTLMAHRATLTGEPADQFTRVAVTGHRPQHIPRDSHDWVQGELARVGRKLQTDHGTQVGISGFAIGADQWWSEAVLDAGLDLWAYIPFETQPARWTPKDQATWARHRSLAARELVLATDYDVRLLHARNEFMIRDADLLICVHDPAKTTGGTASAMSKAHDAGIPLIKINIATRTTTFSPPAR